MQHALFAEVVHLDDRILLWLGQFLPRWPLFNLLIAWLIDARIIKFMPFVLAICWFWFARAPELWTRRQILVEAVLTALGAVFIARTLALALPFRDRPVSNPD